MNWIRVESPLLPPAEGRLQCDALRRVHLQLTLLFWLFIMWSCTAMHSISVGFFVWFFCFLFFYTALLKYSIFCPLTYSTSRSYDAKTTLKIFFFLLLCVELWMRTFHKYLVYLWDYSVPVRLCFLSNKPQIVLFLIDRGLCNLR